MDTLTSKLSPASRQIEALLDAKEKNPLTDFIRQETLRSVESAGFAPSSFDIFAVRRNDQVGSEVFGPKPLHVGTYSEEELYGAAGSPLLRFRSAMQSLKATADRTAQLDPDEVEYGHQTALFWADVGRLKDFMGSSTVISEIVAELRTARFQFIAQDTPKSAVQAIVAALSLVVNAQRLDTSLVDRFVDVMESGGIDPLAPAGLRNFDG